MSSFQNFKESDYISQAEALNSHGSTCDTFVVSIGGRKQFMKVLKKEFASDSAYTTLFQKEFETGRNLSHPNLVKYNSQETTEEGMIMFQDFISGETLAERLARKPEYFRKRGELKRFIQQLLSCLWYLHSNQIVHLDLKPENMMFSQVDNSIKVLDLGFCYTDQYSGLVGKTDEYAAPEQYGADTSGICAQTDLYAVGKILERIEGSSFTSVGKKLPKVYRDLMGKCLQKDISLRPSDAQECIRLINRKATLPWYFLIGIACAILAAILLFPSKGYDIKDRSGNLYRIISDEDLTCEVVGYRKVYDVDGPNIVIDPCARKGEKEYSVVSIADDAFINDTTIMSVYIPEGVVRIGDRALSRCRNIVSLSIPSTVKEIGEDCFSKDSILARIRLPEGLEQLKNNLFVDCHALSSLIVPEGVVSIGKDCFTSCDALSEIHLPTTLELLDRGAFFNCSALPSITLPASLKSIGDYAFYHCDSLRDVYNLSPVPQVIAMIFDRTDITLHVPEQSLELYQNAPGWNELNIVPYLP